MACSSYRVISQPVQVPKVDRSALASCGTLEPLVNGEPLLVFKEWIDQYYKCSNKHQSLVDYIRVIESD